MGESALSLVLGSEQVLLNVAGELAKRWHGAGIERLLIGLEGEIGAGKTTWVRGMLRGLGYRGRVPSPTYTLMEIYEPGELTVVHLDLYRLARAEELENLGVREWLAAPRSWVLVEWPARAPGLARHSDVELALEHFPAGGRRARMSAVTGQGRAALRLAADAESISRYSA